MSKMIYNKNLTKKVTGTSGDTCPIIKPQNIISGKWNLPILKLLSAETRRFNELQRLLPGISKGILTSHLRELEIDDLIHREVYKEVPPKVEYSLTELGISFIPLMNSIAQWGRKFEKHKSELEKTSEIK